MRLTKPCRLLGLTLVEIVVVTLLILLLAIVVVPFYLREARLRQLARVRADMRTLANGVESYYVDNGCYPAMASGSQGANNLPHATSATLSVSTFRIKAGAADPLVTLTTPIAYIQAYFMDPFAPTRGATFGYYTLPFSHWITWSPAPDQQYEIDPIADYDPRSVPHPSILLVQHTYDPTNGQDSVGDVWRAKQ